MCLRALRAARPVRVWQRAGTRSRIGVVDRKTSLETGHLGLRVRGFCLPQVGLHGLSGLLVDQTVEAGVSGQQDGIHPDPPSLRQAGPCTAGDEAIEDRITVHLVGQLGADPTDGGVIACSTPMSWDGPGVGLSWHIPGTMTGEEAISTEN